MDDLEKVETIRTKCSVSYTDAKAALDAANGNVLDAIIWLESQGKTPTTSARCCAWMETSFTPSRATAAAGSPSTATRCRIPTSWATAC